MKTGKRIPTKIVLALLLLIASGYYCYVNYDYYFQSDYPLAMKADFEYLDYAAIDAQSNIYRIDRSMQRISKTSPDGKVEFLITCHDSPGERSLFLNMAVGDYEKIYVKRLYVDSTATYVIREEIVEYSTQDLWPKPRVLVSDEYTRDDNVVKPGKIIDLEYRDGSINFYELQGQSVTLRSYNTETGKEQKLTAVIPGNYDISTVAYLPPSTIYFNTRQGEIYKTIINTEGIEKIEPYYVGDYNQWGYFSEQEEARLLLNYSNPAIIAVNDENNIYLADMGERSIKCISYAPDFFWTIPAPNSNIAGNNLEAQAAQGMVEPSVTKWYMGKILSESKFRDLLARNGMHDNIMAIKSMNVGPNGTLVSVISDNVLIIKDQKKAILASPQAPYANRLILVNMLMWIFLIIFGITCIYCLIYFNTYCVRRKIIRKQIALYIIIMLLVQVAVTYMTYLQIDYILTQQIKKQLTSKVNIAVAGLNRYHPVQGGFSSYSDDLASIHGPDNYMNDSYKSLLLYMKENQNNDFSQDEIKADKSLGEDIWYAFAALFTGDIKLNIPRDNYYSVVYLVEEYEAGQNIFNIWIKGKDKMYFYPYFISEETDLAQYNLAVTANRTEFFEYQRDTEGEYIFIIKPFKYMTPAGEKTALYEFGMDRTILTNYESIIFKNTFSLVLAILIICTGLIYYFTYRLLFPLRRLKKGVEKMDGKHWNSDIVIKTGDEMEALANSFNRMNANLRKHITDIENTKMAYSRFVPDQINKHLNKKCIVDIALRDQNTVSMGVLMTSIRGFYNLSKNMSAQESFDYINNFLAGVGPVIPKNNGFINEFTGFGLKSLFPASNQSEGCMQAALEMQRIAQQISDEQVLSGKEAFTIGIAAHKCVDLILGIVGFQNSQEDRYQATVIHEGVVLTELLEKLGPSVGASIIVTESIIKDLPNPEEYQFRYLGLFAFDTVNEPVNIYDLYQGDSPDIRKLKERTQEAFEKAVKLYQEQQFEAAKYIFIDIIGINNRDEAAKIYFYLCDEYAKNLPRNWSRAIHLDRK